MNKFVKREIDLTFQLGTGTFGETGFNQVELTGLRVKLSFLHAGGATGGLVTLKIYGLSESMMNQLTQLTKQLMMIRNNILTIKAGDAINGTAVIFIGTITEGWADFNSSPDAILHISASSGYYQMIKSVPPLSYKGTVSVATIMQTLATNMGFLFKNNGVTAQLSTQYLQGTSMEQARRVAENANINWDVDCLTLYIWPKGSSKFGAPITISPQTGMVGYPAYNSTGVDVKTVFNPLLRYGMQANVQSRFKMPSGVWFIHGISHELESMVPDGDWFTNFQGSPLGSYVIAK